MAESLDTGINTYNYQPTLYILGKVASFTESVGPDFKMNPGSTLLDYGAGDGAIAAALVLKYEINRADLVDTDRIESVPNVLSGRVRCFKSPRNKIEIPSDSNMAPLPSLIHFIGCVR